MTGSKVLGLVVAAVMIVAGLVFTFQGLGYLKGSTMTGDHTWAVIGPILAGLGVALVIVMLQDVRRRP